MCGQRSGRDKIKDSKFRPLPHYKCIKCGHAWIGDRPKMVSCPECPSLYVEWTNYEKDFEPHLYRGARIHWGAERGHQQNYPLH